MQAKNAVNQSRVPFMISAGQKPPNMNTPRILEQIIAAAIIGAIVLYGTVQMLGSDIKALQKDIQRIERNQNKLYSDFYQPAIPMYDRE